MLTLLIKWTNGNKFTVSNICCYEVDNLFFHTDNLSRMLQAEKISVSSCKWTVDLDVTVPQNKKQKIT